LDVDRYNSEVSYKNWFDDNYPEYSSIYEAVGLEESLLIPAPFVDETKDPQDYVDRYNSEVSYKNWFDDNHPEYSSIYEAVGLEEPVKLASFVDPNIDPQYYVDRYNTEVSYKNWFDDNHPEFSSIYEAVGLEEPVELAPFVDPNIDPQYYVDRYNTEPQYKEWFDSNFPDMTIYQAVGLEESEIKEPEFGECGLGTKLIDGECKITDNTTNGGGCLIATATYGSELAPQVQMLREIRDNTLLPTNSGQNFMIYFNQFYYSFSPTIADWERENPFFKETVRIAITPMLSTLSIMNYAENDSEGQVIALGISIIALNVGMYVASPIIFAVKLKKKLFPSGKIIDLEEDLY